MNIKELENRCLKPILYTVYGNDLCGDTLQDLLSNMVAYINEVIEQTNDTTNLVQGLYDYVKNQGLKEEVIKQLNIMIDNGTFDQIINQEIFGDLYNDVEGLNVKTDNIIKTIDHNKKETDKNVEILNKEVNILRNINNNKKMLIAHRGFGSIYPENTIYAFQESIRNGANAIEFDVQPTKDGELVVIHDSTLDRTTNGTGRVDSKTLSEIKALDAGYKFFNNTLTGITIPTVDEIFQNINTEFYYWEIKEYRNNADVEKMVEYIVEHGLEDRVILSTFNWRELIPVIRNISQRVCIDCTVSTQDEFTSAFELCRLDNRLGISMNATLSNRENNALLQKLAIRYEVWTFQDQNAYNYHKQFGINNIISDVVLEV